MGAEACAHQGLVGCTVCIVLTHMNTITHLNCNSICNCFFFVGSQSTTNPATWMSGSVRAIKMVLHLHFTTVHQHSTSHDQFQLVLIWPDVLPKCLTSKQSDMKLMTRFDLLLSNV